MATSTSATLSSSRSATNTVPAVGRWPPRRPAPCRRRCSPRARRGRWRVRRRSSSRRLRYQSATYSARAVGRGVDAHRARRRRGSVSTTVCVRMSITEIVLAVGVGDEHAAGAAGRHHAGRRAAHRHGGHHLLQCQVDHRDIVAALVGDVGKGRATGAAAPARPADERPAARQRRPRHAVTCRRCVGVNRPPDCSAHEAQVVASRPPSAFSSPSPLRQEIEAEVRVLADREVDVGRHHRLAAVGDVDLAHEVRRRELARVLVHRQAGVVGVVDHQLREHRLCGRLQRRLRRESASAPAWPAPPARPCRPAPSSRPRPSRSAWSCSSWPSLVSAMARTCV